MTSKLLYNLAIPATAQSRNRNNRRRQISSAGTLGDGQPAVEPISPEAESRRIRAVFTSKYADLMAAEFRELWSSSGVDIVPYTSADAATLLEEGYYSLERADNLPATPREPRSQQFEGALTKIGTRRSHWRSVKTAPTTEDNPFGTATTEELGVSAEASKVRWYDPVGGTLESATVQTTSIGEHGDVSIYDATEPSFDNPTLIYTIPYRQEWPTDPRVWDDRGEASRDVSTTDGDVLLWQRVFSTDHEYAGLPVISNDYLRLTFDEPNQEISAEKWNSLSGNDAYESVSLGSSSWRLYDVNLTRIGTERVDGQVELEDTNNPGTTYNLNMSLKRGYANALFTVPENEGSTPQGVIDRLDVIAATSDRDPSGVADVIKRTETDR